MIVTTHEGLQWAQNYCKEIREKFPELEAPKQIMVLDLTIAYQKGAQFIQDELKKVRMKLRDKQMATTETEETEQLTTIKNEELFAAYEEAIRQIDNILEL